MHGNHNPSCGKTTHINLGKDARVRGERDKKNAKRYIPSDNRETFGTKGNACCIQGTHSVTAVVRRNTQLRFVEAMNCCFRVRQLQQQQQQQHRCQRQQRTPAEGVADPLVVLFVLLGRTDPSQAPFLCTQQTTGTKRDKSAGGKTLRKEEVIPYIHTPYWYELYTSTTSTGIVDQDGGRYGTWNCCDVILFSGKKIKQGTHPCR